MKRRSFVQYTIALTGLPALAGSCKSKQLIPGEIIGANSALGHKLRDMNDQAPFTAVPETDVVIVGAGISGLSAARWLKKQGIEKVMVFELENSPGGNAMSGRNEISAFPLGAHYIPIPNNDLEEYLAFLHEINVIASFDKDGLPEYNDFHLCFDPEERLYINGRWQDGLIPSFGVPDNDLAEIEKFLNEMDKFRHMKGTDQKDAFAIPVDRSSKDENLRNLDQLTMKQWLDKHEYKSEYLHWYVNYCTRDDFGTTYERCSAWAGIHYFASRKGKAQNATHSDVLTWPEGNGFLVNGLRKDLLDNIKTDCLVLSVKEENGKVNVLFYDNKSKVNKRVSADHCIISTPQFITSRLTANPNRKDIITQHFHYTPWVVANLVVGQLEERSGSSLSWDNVIYGSDSLGYVNSTHQLIDQHLPKRNLTYYLPLTGGDAAEERKIAHQKTHQEWTEKILNDLSKIHPDIRNKTERIDIMLWGHAMAQPLPGMIHGETRQHLKESTGRIHYAHTDLAGISIFEEGFYQGIDAAMKVINQEKRIS